jgi:O-antigen/teichoic acid export membrane protein
MDDRIDREEARKVKVKELKKLYKRYRFWQTVTFIVSVALCIVPVVASCIRAAPSMEKSGGKWALCGVGVFFAAVILLIVCRSLINKFISAVPYTLIVLISVGAMLGLMFCLKQIIDDAIAVLLVGLVGSAGAFVLELISMGFKSHADDIAVEYKRGKYDVGA